ncbi:hypothetical protein HID58_003694 [Brassica napus]|uniref:Rho GDP-dissociation inhibitor 1 n=1 Tax=Brassica napus TaxID=3708 RepID=A0ABQ8EQT3_BRANA|nr:hypothetical protein HID58_003694 [Brassica napus]
MDNNNNKNNEENGNTSKTASDDEGVGSVGRQMSESSLCVTEEEEEDDSKLHLGPQYTIKEHLEKDKDDESLRKWKEQLLGSVDVTNIGETLDPEVRIISLVILSPGRPDIVLMVPENGNPKGMWFTLKEGSRYCLKFTFQVNNNIVSGLRTKFLDDDNKCYLEINYSFDIRKEWPAV